MDAIHRNPRYAPPPDLDDPTIGAPPVNEKGLGLVGRWVAIPIPPPVSEYYRGDSHAQKTGGRFLTKTGKLFKREVFYAIRHLGHRKPLEGRVRIVVIYHTVTAGPSDLDNRWKALKDALTYAGVYKDDAQVDDERALRGVPLKGGLCRLLVEEIDVQNCPLMPLPTNGNMAPPWDIGGCDWRAPE